jgi:hypothetical protein
MMNFSIFIDVMKLRVIESFLYFNPHLAAFTAIQKEFSRGRKFIKVFDST